ncbi:hypothetical protein [Peribacillus asahii]|uniref:hypothetical protein n=1 Tax=Peribacillus asahii TaxID=228899 RepID=UPI0038261289
MDELIIRTGALLEVRSHMDIHWLVFSWCIFDEIYEPAESRKTNETRHLSKPQAG